MKHKLDISGVSKPVTTAGYEESCVGNLLRELKIPDECFCTEVFYESDVIKNNNYIKSSLEIQNWTGSTFKD